MAINIRSINCPNCGASVSYDENHKTVNCSFCGAVLDMTEEYGPKQDRIRDDIQDMQIKQIMNNMNGQTTNARDADMKRKKSLALKIVFTIIGVYLGLYIIGAVITFIVMGAKAGKMISTGGSSQTKEVEVDPFENLTISYYGKSGQASGRIHDSNVYGISSLEKKISDLEGLSNGDTVTVEYKTDHVENSGKKYILTQTKKTFTVEGLEEYVTDIHDVGEEDYAVLEKGAINLAKSTCESDLPGYLPDSFELCAIYTLVKKDFSEQMSVFIISFDYNGDEGAGTGYFMAEYDEVVRLASGDYRINFNPKVFTYSRESYFGGFTLTSGHSTWDAAYADVYLNNKADYNVYENYISEELSGK